MFDGAYRKKTDASGHLRLDIETGILNSEVDVRVHVDAAPCFTEAEWAEFVKATAGKADASFVRPRNVISG